MTPPSNATAATRVQGRPRSSKGFLIKRMFTKKGIHPFDELTWDKRTITVRSGKGKVYEAKDLDFPSTWSQNAANIAGSKYFRGRIGSSEKERSVKQMVGRVARTIREWGQRLGYFRRQEDAEAFEMELTHLLVNQKAAFNSPVWFNVGLREKPQCSACFILKVEDNMESILDWIKIEGMIFRMGSGAGLNLSPLRSSRETLSRGGYASGPVSFMRGADAVAGMIKSGGETRRAAKMVILNADHPDIMEFIRCKAEEEKKVRALMAAGYDMQDLNNEAWNSIQYQNANNSVRVTDAFMKAVEGDSVWETRFVTQGEVAETFRARDIFREIAQAAWECADPGMQFDTTINNWHTCPNTGPITASNPCSEYMHIDNSACNLASINLMKFYNPETNTFLVDEYKHAVDVMILAQDIIVDGSSYPTPEIEKNARDFRQLGLGFANLGAVLMARGLPYDSEEARAFAGAVTALMCGQAYRYSAEIARVMGAFDGYESNKEPMLRVIGMHRAEIDNVNSKVMDDQNLLNAAREAWDEALEQGKKYGFRNSQVTLIAPTGTIALMMDCDTTGIEPDFALVKMKQLVGGGTMKIVNQTVPLALRRLGYAEKEIKDIVAYAEKKGMMEEALHLKEEHLAVFDCAVKPPVGTRSISWQGHVRMVAAVQPFISGAISKTFNMSEDTTVEEIMDAFMLGWRLGVKAFAVYRDGSKAAQPLQTTGHKGKAGQLSLGLGVSRRRLPPTRSSETHKFSIAGHEGYLTYSIYDDGSLAEVFVRMAKQGSTLAGLLDAFAITVSMALQYGVPLKDLARKFIYGRFEPAGITENPDIRIATSITDYIFRYLALRFLNTEDLEEFGMASLKQNEENKEAPELKQSKVLQLSNGNGFTFAGTVCRDCGGMMIRTGSCLTCLQCGATNGGCA